MTVSFGCGLSDNDVSSTVFCAIGVYSINNQPFDVVLTAFFGLTGYLLIKLGFEPAPMLVAFVLGKIMEEKLRQAMLLSRGDPWTFVDFGRHPISTVLIVISVALLALAVTPALRKKRNEVFVEE